MSHCIIDKLKIIIEIIMGIDEPYGVDRVNLDNCAKIVATVEAYDFFGFNRVIRNTMRFSLISQ
jgi:hypothetical protein